MAGFISALIKQRKDAKKAQPDTNKRFKEIDIVTSVVMHDAYSLKRTVLTIAQPKGEINHGAILGMCEDMCGQFTGTDFGDFDLGDLLGSILGGLQEDNFTILLLKR